MQIVIDIPEEVYIHLLNGGNIGVLIENTIKNGTPLPKGHGRLIDADALKDIWHGCKFNGSIDTLLDCRPTVIEAQESEES